MNPAGRSGAALDFAGNSMRLALARVKLGRRLRGGAPSRRGWCRR